MAFAIGFWIPRVSLREMLPD